MAAWILSRQHVLPTFLLFCLVLSLSKQANAIGMRHDLPGVDSNDSTNPHVALGASFDAVAHISWTTRRGTFTGTGTLVASLSGDYKLLTAAHNVDGSAGARAPDSIIDASHFTVSFGDSLSAVTHEAVVPRDQVTVNPRWWAGDPFGTGLSRGAGQFDIAVLTFSASDLVFGAVDTLPAPYEVHATDPSGQPGTFVGFGRVGTGDDFASLSNRVRRAGQNWLDAHDALSDAPNDGLTIRSDFDSPEAVATSVSNYDGPLLALEASTGKGDSGGPLLLNAMSSKPRVVGVLHGGYNDFGEPSEYGDVSVWASTNEEINLAFLQASDVAIFGSAVAASIAPFSFPIAPAIPEPSSAGLSLVGMIFLLLFRSRRACD